MNTRRRGVLPALLWLFLASCDPFTHDPAAFFDEQTGGITLGLPAVVDGTLTLGTDGYICLKAGETGFSIPLDNPRGYALTVESSFTRTMGAGISGLTVTQTGEDRLAVNMPPGITDRNEGTLHIKVKTAAEGRILYEGDLGIAYIDFDTSLKAGTGLSVSSTLDPYLNLNEPFAPGAFNYSVNDAPVSFTVAAAAENSAARIIINGETLGTGSGSLRIMPPPGSSIVPIRVEAPHGTAYREYTISVSRSFQGITISTEPTTKVYVQQGSPNTGFSPAGMVLTASTTGGEAVVGSGQYSILDYDFTTPGEKTVVVSYKGSTAAITVWVVGLSGLTLTGPGGYAPALNFDRSSAAAYNKDLGTVPFTATPLTITATSGLAGVEGATLSMKVNTGSSQAITSGAAVPVPIPQVHPASNTIQITAGLTKGSQTVTRTYTITVRRVSLSVDEFFVSQTGSDTSGDGSAAAPYGTVKKALDVVKTSGLTQADTFTITISGTITADTGTSDEMIDISGTGYPKIVLQGKGTGSDAGVINAAGKNKRVLCIADGNKVALGANLTLTGGSTTSGGGVFVTYTSTFEMTGGTIAYNTASEGGGGVYVTGTFEMSGGTIAHNTSGTLGGGGVYVSSGTFEMSGGTIEHNTDSSSSYGGGGVYVTYGTFKMSGDAVIRGNTAYRGGGVYVLSDNGVAFTKKGNALIYGDTGDSNANTATGGDGHAVYLLLGKKRNATAGASLNLYAKYNSGWSYNDVGGVGDTTAHWE
jgi:hypothetical protein